VVRIFYFFIILGTVLSQKPYHGAEYRTVESFLYGRFEARMKTASGSGVVSSFFSIRDFWAEGLGDPQNWCEIDFEGLGNQNYSIQTNIISAGETHHEELLDMLSSPHENFTTYAFEWTPDYIAFFINDSIVRYSNDSYVSSFIYPQKVMMNIWQPIWEDWVGIFNPDVLPVYAFYDWVKYYNYTPGFGTSGSENNFSLEWVDNFNYFDDSRWQKATHSWYSNNAQFIQGNAVFRYGNLILCLTSNTTSGYNPTPLGTNLEHDKFIQTKESPIYPNPFNSNLLISLSNQEQKELTGINIFDLSGKIIFNKKFAKNTDSYIKIDFSNSSLSSGVYFVEIIFTSKKQFLKTTYLR